MLGSAAVVLFLSAYQAVQNIRFAPPAVAGQGRQGTLMSTTAIRRINFAAGREAVQARPARAVAAQTVATQLFIAEKAVDSATGEVAKLMSILLEARREAGLSTTVGNPLLEDAAAAQTALVQALQRVSALHASGLELTEKLRLPRMDFGDSGEKPAPGPSA